MLNWRSTLNTRQTVQFTVNWYRNFLENEACIEEFSRKQIENFSSTAEKWITMVNVGFACKELDMVEVPGGNIVKLLKNTDEDFRGFGEAYFSYINSGAVKAWKKHLSMNLFLTVH